MTLTAFSRLLGVQPTNVARTEREIALMQEYRTRLTADVVTGKLDVRPAAAKLPDLDAEESNDDDLDSNELNENDDSDSDV